MNEIRTSCKRMHWHKEFFFDKDIKIEMFLIIEPPQFFDSKNYNTKSASY